MADLISLFFRLVLSLCALTTLDKFTLMLQRFLLFFKVLEKWLLYCLEEYVVFVVHCLCIWGFLRSSGCCFCSSNVIADVKLHTLRNVVICKYSPLTVTRVISRILLAVENDLEQSMSVFAPFWKQLYIFYDFTKVQSSECLKVLKQHSANMAFVKLLSFVNWRWGVLYGVCELFSRSPSPMKRNWPHMMFCVMPSPTHQITKTDFCLGLLECYLCINTLSRKQSLWKNL